MSEKKSKEIDASALDMSAGEDGEIAAMPPAPPIVMDDVQAEMEEREREAAYSEEPEWKGELLQPFSFSRKSLFYSHRVSMGAPHLLEVLGDSMAFLGDALRILYFCAHDPAEYRHLRAKPELLQDAIDAWSDEQVESEEDALEAVTTALTLYNASEVNKAEAVPSGGPGRDDELGN